MALKFLSIFSLIALGVAAHYWVEDWYGERGVLSRETSFVLRDDDGNVRFSWNSNVESPGFECYDADGDVVGLLTVCGVSQMMGEMGELAGPCIEFGASFGTLRFSERGLEVTPSHKASNRYCHINFGPEKATVTVVEKNGQSADIGVYYTFNYLDQSVIQRTERLVGGKLETSQSRLELK